jgi:hypothetical protein
MTTNDIDDLFDQGTDWEFAAPEVGHFEGFHPNILAYREATATVGLICKRSTAGGDCSVSEAGLVLIEAMQNRGARKDGKAVRSAFVVYSEVDPHAAKIGQLKVISSETPQDLRKRLAGIQPKLGNYGRYWWVSPPIAGDFENRVW